jgi:hypothetical protein
MYACAAYIIFLLSGVGLAPNPQVAILYSNPASISQSQAELCCQFPLLSRG